MKKYKLSLGVRLLGTISSLAFIGLGVYGVSDSRFSLETFIFFLPCIFLGVAGAISYILSKIEVDNEKLKIIGDLVVFKSEQVVFWNDIKRIESMFFLVHEISWISIHFNRKGKEQKIEILITSYPREFIKEFFENIPKSIEIYLHPSLRKKLLAIVPELAVRGDN